MLCYDVAVIHLVEIYSMQVSMDFPFLALFIIKFLVPPKITKVEPDRRLVVNAGQSKNLTCEASGGPKPNITWTREGFTEAQFNASGHQLHLGSIQRKDIGGYKCTADNGYGTATSLFVLNINCKLQQLKKMVLSERVSILDTDCVRLYFHLTCSQT